MDKASPKIGVEYVKNATIATLTDERILDESDIQALENTIMPLIQQDPGLNLIICFSEVRFLSSAVLGLLIRISKKVYESNGQLKLCAIKQNILAIFKITRLDRVFDIYEDREKALENLD